jgi:hypothetical protein
MNSRNPIDDLVRWLAPSLARFELPDPSQAPPDLPLVLNAAFGLDFQGTRLIQALAPAVSQHSGGRVTLRPVERPIEGSREGAYVALSGEGRERQVLISATGRVAEWVV